MGILQIIAGAMHWGRFIRLVPHPVMLGFVNGLAIVIFLAQLGQQNHWASIVEGQFEPVTRLQPSTLTCQGLQVR